jgi:chemotaxis protein MotB
MSEVLRRRNRTPKEKANHERWMISYADMLTLLLAFFILLWSAATVNKAKLMQEAAGMLQAFEGTPPMLVETPSTPRGIEHATPEPAPRPAASSEPPTPQAKQEKQEKQKQEKQILSRAEQQRLQPMIEGMKKLRQSLDQLLAPEIAEQQIALIDQPLSLRIRLNAQILFPSAQATLTPTAETLLSSLGDTLAKLAAGYLITVQGYTDDRPIRTPNFSSNWDLSTARAVSVVHLFRTRDVPGENLSAEGFSKFRPISENDTEAGRAANRRVEILITVPKEKEGSDAE